jgi:2-amino-4-hydroxy-6-hydroxymethyldihydropteridine diphosphokinase
VGAERSHPDLMEVPVLLGLGANVGDPRRQLAEAIDRLAPFVRIAAVSSVYRTDPVGFLEQPDFLNIVCAGATALTATRLHGELQAIERALGRERTVPNAPRRIDIDLLAYGDRVIETPDLVVPHPRLHERAFVLVPLLEVAPHWRHPRSGETPAELLARLDRPGGVHRIGALRRGAADAFDADG